MVNDAVFLRHVDALEPVGEALRDALLPEAFLIDAGRIPLHRDRPPANVRQQHRRDRFVVRRELAFGDAVLGEQHFLGMRDHGASRTTSRAALSKRTPSSRGWRSLPCTVHSMKATCTTIAGCAQCARSRGSPFARVNGDFGISRRSSRARRSSRSFVSKPVPILPANTKSSLSKYPTSSAPRPTRAPCGSVKPPTTSSCDASHFIFSQWGDRRCS